MVLLVTPGGSVGNDFGFMGEEFVIVGNGAAVTGGTSVLALSCFVVCPGDPVSPGSAVVIASV